MKDLAVVVHGIDIPGFGSINNPDQLTPAIASRNLADVIYQFLTLGLVLAGFLMVAWAMIGIIQFTISGSNKETAAVARKRITWAITGFIIVIISFAIAKYVQSILLPGGTP